MISRMLAPNSTYVVQVVLAAFALGVSCAFAQHDAASTQWLRPPALQPGDTIAFVAPAGPAEWPPLMEYAAQLRRAGFKVRIPKKIADRKLQYLAGSDRERAVELNAMIRDPTVRAIFPARGGYGLTRILDEIDYAALRADPKIITGYSDLTALHLAVASRSRLVTFHAPMPMKHLWEERNPDYAFAAHSFRRLVFFDRSRTGELDYRIEVPDEFRPVRVVGGKSRGRLMGGNLTLICATLGTPYAINPRGAILFIEDVDEAPYRIDRALSQLRLAGILDEVAGAVLGTFTDDEKEDTKEFDRVLLDYFGSLDVPVVMHYPVGHTRFNATLPHGGLVELDADELTIRLLEPPVAPCNR